MNDMPETTPPAPAPVKKEGGVGSISAIIIIIALLVLGGGYYFMTSVDRLSEDATPEEMAQGEVASLESQSASDELAAIEADVAATNLAPLDEASAGFEGELSTQ